MLTVIDSTQKHKIAAILQDMDVKGAHFTNGTFARPEGMVVPTVLAGFQFMLDGQPHLPLIMAVNSDVSMHRLDISHAESETQRAFKVAVPLSETFPESKVIVLFYDEETPCELYAALKRHGHTRTLHKWGYGTDDPSAKRIEGAEYFDFVYGFPLPNDEKAVCWDQTPEADVPQNVKTVDLRDSLIAGDGVLFELPNSLKEYQSSAMTQEKNRLLTGFW